MTFQEFNKSAVLPVGIGAPLQALWLDNQGDWDGAHELAQRAGGREGAWVHAYLHRKEGDEMNASYWYARAGRPVVTGDLRAEWEAMVRELLGDREQS